jgi:hypothetical protein
MAERPALQGEVPNTKGSLGRYEASRDDLAVYSVLRKVPDPAEFPNAARWYNHIAARLDAR